MILVSAGNAVKSEDAFVPEGVRNEKQNISDIVYIYYGSTGEWLCKF